MRLAVYGITLLIDNDICPYSKTQSTGAIFIVMSHLTLASTKRFHCTAPCRKRFQSYGALSSHRTQSLNCQRRWERHLETRSKTVAPEAIDNTPDTVVPPENPVNVAHIEEDMGWEPSFYIPADFSMDVSLEVSIGRSVGSAPVEMEPPQEAPGVDGSAAERNEPVAMEEIYKNAGWGYGQQETSFQALHKQQLEKGQGNIYYPFSCYQDFELAVWLHESGLSQTQINKYLKLSYVRNYFIQYNIVLIISSHALGLLLSQLRPDCAISLRSFPPRRLIGNPKWLYLNMESSQNLQHYSIATL
jgi:hypothetical protein